MKFPKPKTRSLRYMNRFDALELHACVERKGQNGVRFVEQEDEAKNPTMFSVYGHLISPGGIFCLEDFKTHPAALAWMKMEAARCRFELGYEDYWEHGQKEQKPTGEEIWLRRNGHRADLRG